MINPYAAAFEELRPQFLNAGLVREEEREYEMTYSDARIKLRFSTERYLHPQLNVTLQTSDGRIWDLNLLERAISPDRAARDEEERSRLLSSLNVDQRTIAEILEGGPAYQYATLVIKQTLAFLKENSDAIGHADVFEARYSAVQVEFLRAFGI